MISNQIFLPVLVQILITISGYLLLGVRKSRAVKSNNVDLEKAALDNDAWPDYVRVISNNIRNQFQVPVLFYVLCILFYSIDAVSAMVLYLAWAFVISRAIHAYIHMSSNYVPARFTVFTIGFIIMIVMVVFAAIALLSA
jgi:hypothetical protein